MFHYLYKITRSDGAYYYGIHSTENIDDGYFGSGTRLTNSVKKHGRNAHSMEILEFFDNRHDAESSEEQIVNESLLCDPLCLNLVKGGRRGPEQHLKTTREKISDGHRGRILSERHRLAISKALDGKEKTKEHRQKLSEAAVKRISQPDYVNPWSGEAGSIMSTQKNLDRVANGTNPWAGEKGSQNSKWISQRQIEEGSHPFQQEHVIEHIRERVKRQITDGTHPFQNIPKLTCQCGKTGSAQNMRRWHFENCKVSPLANL